MPSITPAEYIEIISKRFAREGDPVRAEGQMRYMRNLHPYYGLKAPEWVGILREIYSEKGFFTSDELFDFVRQCYEEEYRELHYAGLQMLERQIRKLRAKDIDFLQECALKKSWWDTVDWINKFVGIHFKNYPELQRPTAEKWGESDNIWLQRLSIIHQLTYKDNTDWQLLKEMILKQSDSREFFVQKGSGWALRQYSKTNGDAVIEFINEHPELPALTRREGLKWLRNNRMI